MSSTLQKSQRLITLQLISSTAPMCIVQQTNKRPFRTSLPDRPLDFQQAHQLYPAFILDVFSFSFPFSFPFPRPLPSSSPFVATPPTPLAKTTPPAALLAPTLIPRPSRILSMLMILPLLPRRLALPLTLAAVGDSVPSVAPSGESPPVGANRIERDVSGVTGRSPSSPVTGARLTRIRVVFFGDGIEVTCSRAL